MLALGAVLLVVTAHAVAQPGVELWPWRPAGGSSATAILSAAEDFSFTVAIARANWTLRSGGAAIRCAGRQYSSGDGSLVRAGAPRHGSGRETPGRGPFVSLTQRWAAGSCCNLSTAIRYYAARDSFEFLHTIIDGAHGTEAVAPPPLNSTLSNKPTDTLATEFPTLLLGAPTPPQLPGLVSWGDGGIGPAEILLPAPVTADLSAWAATAGMDAGPVVLFSPSPSNSTGFAPAVVIGLGNHFTSTALSRRATDGALAAGANGYISNIPAGWTVSVGLTARQGVNSAMLAWGEALRAQHATTRLTLDDDKLSSSLSYVQDDGGYYCFCEYTDRHLNNRSGFAPAGKTMTELKRYHARVGLDIGVYHIDPYWYSRCPGDPRCPDKFSCGDPNHPASCAASRLEPNQWHFPGGIKAAASDVPMMLFMSHAFNWGEGFQPEYVKEYAWQPATWPFWCVYSSVAPNASFAFWHFIIGKHVKESNLQAMTMDMLTGTQYAFASNMKVADAAQEMQAGYAAAAAAHKLPFRVDLHTAPLALASVDQSSWVTSRCNGDATPQSSGGLRDSVVGASLFLSCINVRPMMDVLWTTPIQPGDPYNCGIPCIDALGPPSVRMNLQRDMIVAVLSAGPVGIGDMVGRTDVSLLRTALREDSVILKPAHPLLRLEKYYAGEKAMVWLAPSVPATSALAAKDRRANSFARLEGVLYAEDPAALWWHSLLASEVAAVIALKDIFPTPGPSAAFLVGWRFGWPVTSSPCVNGSRASSCLRLLNEANPLHINTGSAQQSQCVARPNMTVAYKLLQLAPVLPSGWVLLGELSKIVPVSPQRFLTRTGSAVPSEDASDAILPAELSSTGDDLQFRIIGAANETVECTVVAPDRAATVVEGSMTQTAATKRAIEGTVLVLRVQLSLLGTADVHCLDSGCTYPVAPGQLSQTSLVGCSDGSCEGYCNTTGVAACAANWTGAMSLRRPRTANGSPCGGAKMCSSPSDACADGWSICLSRGKTSSGHSTAAALVAAVSAAECATGSNGSYATAMSSARRFPCPSQPPGCDMGCEVASYGAEPVCCGTECRVPSCANGVWPSPGTLIKMGAGPPDRGCGAIMGGWMTGVLCCKDE